MTSGPPFAQLAAKALSSTPPRTSASTEADEARTVAAMARALRENANARRNRRRALAALLFAAAAAVLLAAGATKWGARGTARGVTGPIAMTVATSVRGAVFVTSNGQKRPLIDGAPVAIGDAVNAEPDGFVVLTLGTGTRIALEGGGALLFVDQGATQLFRLSAGSMRADVAKLHFGERFIVRTDDANVEVRGTSFRVTSVPPDRSCGNGTTTRVAVYEGVVAVRAGEIEAYVPAGNTWPAGCGAAIPTTTGATPSDSSPGTPPSAAPGASQRAPHGTATVAPASSIERARSALSAQNDLFDGAVEAKRRGNVATALAGFERLLAVYPSGPLAEAAMAERMKLLGKMDSVRGAAAAHEYLARYPSGFAHADAEAILARDR